MANLSGVNRLTGHPYDGLAHLKQSITDILTTPVGSRVMRPEYGSHLPRMVDLPTNKGWIAAVQAEVSRALQRWEPRFTLRRCRVTAIDDGKITIRTEGNYVGENLLIEVTV